jgi:hypothetical protein
MARRQNEMFIGSEHLNVEGRAIKHIALIKLFATVNLNKTSEEPIKLLGVDIETDYKTAELKLIGFWNGKQYTHYTDNFINILYSYVKGCYKNEVSFAYWNKLDPFVIYKQFLKEIPENQRATSLLKYSKVTGEWDKENQTWKIKPVVEIELNEVRFGILQAIRSSIQFFFYRLGDKDIKTVWAFDIAQLYQNGLETESLKRLDYYSKVDKSAHLVDWKRFETDLHYKNNIVLKSNELDSRAVYDLGLIIQHEFKNAFKFFPRSLISQGSLARSAIVATLYNMHNGEIPKITDDVKSIGIVNYLDYWAEHFGEDLMKDLLCLSFEAYSGGQIESYMYGYAKEAYTVDLAQAYPAHINELLDLRGSKIIKGYGEPIRTENSYIFIRGDVNIPVTVDYHCLTIKHHIHKETNIRAVGEYRASYIIEERDLLVELGATFTNEEWIRIETNGQLSPLAKVSKDFIKLREKLRPEGKDYVAKTSSASLYGILFEAVDTYIETNKTIEIDISDDFTYYKKLLKPYKKNINLESVKNGLKYYLGNDIKKVFGLWHSKKSNLTPDVVAQEIEKYGIYLEATNPIDMMLEINNLYHTRGKKEIVKEVISEVAKAGYRGGEFLNPIYATIITAKTRIQISRALNSIKAKGGKPILAMTDSVFWEGTADMIPSEMIREPKTVGYFETPQHVTDLVCLGSGRYGYKSDNGYMQSKKRGLNAVDIHDPQGIIIDEQFNWLNALKIMERTKLDKIEVKVRSLISVGQLLNNHKYTYKDLGMVVEELREVDVIVGKQKRIYDDDIKDSSLLAKQLVETEPIVILKGMDGLKTLNDQTLPFLRNKLMKMKFKSTKEKKETNSRKTSNTYYNKNKSTMNELRKQNYQMLRDYEYNSKIANKMATWSIDKIKNKLREDLKI